MFLRNSQFFVTNMSHSRWFQSRTLGFMPNALPFEVDLPVRVPERIKSVQNTMSQLDL